MPSGRIHAEIAKTFSSNCRAGNAGCGGRVAGPESESGGAKPVRSSSIGSTAGSAAGVRGGSGGGPGSFAHHIGRGEEAAEVKKECTRARARWGQRAKAHGWGVRAAHGTAQACD